MTSREFCYWLQGYFELNSRISPQPLTLLQQTIIAKHLEMVFAHEIDPIAGDAQHQAKLNALHEQQLDKLKEINQVLPTRPRC